MPRTYITSDTHFGHANILKFEQKYRPFNSIEEHDEELIRRWNSVVRNGDTVWHLGDVLFGKKSFDILPRLNGNKKLILGNHDVYPMEEYQKHFKKIHSAAVVNKNILLTHVPVHPNQLEYRLKLNVHGHMHSGSLPDNRYKCVSVEHTNLTPILLQDLICT